MQVVTALAHSSGDDFPLAALKHAQDARALLDATRYDGAAYLAGYAVECAAKALILHDQAYDPTTRATDPEVLAQWREKLRRKPYGHDLARLLSETLGTSGQRYAHFLPDPNAAPLAAIIAGWKETMRYREPHVGAPQASAYVEWASLAEEAVASMQLDGVL